MDGWIFQSFPFGVSPYLQGQKLLVSGSVFPVRNAFPPFQRCFSGFICNFKSQVTTPKCWERAVFSKLYAKMIKFLWFWGGSCRHFFMSKASHFSFSFVAVFKNQIYQSVTFTWVGGCCHIFAQGPLRLQSPCGYYAEAWVFSHLWSSGRGRLRLDLGVRMVDLSCRTPGLNW